MSPVSCFAEPDGVAIGAVEGRGVFGGVGQDQRVVEAVGLQRLADGLDAAVHHVRGGDDVGPGMGVDEGLFGQPLQRGVVERSGRPPARRRGRGRCSSPAPRRS